MVILAVVYGCSKDHESPTFSKFEDLMKMPNDLIATFSKTTDTFNLQWSMADTNSVKKYYIAWSDSNVFDEGKNISSSNQFTQNLDTQINLDVSKVMKAMGYITLTQAQKDSFIVYFTVSAVYSNDLFNEFIGPRSVIDSALVFRK